MRTDILRKKHHLDEQDPLMAGEICWNAAAPSWTSIIAGLFAPVALVFALCFCTLIIVSRWFLSGTFWAGGLGIAVSGAIALFASGCIVVLSVKHYVRWRAFVVANRTNKPSQR